MAVLGRPLRACGDRRDVGQRRSVRCLASEARLPKVHPRRVAGRLRLRRRRRGLRDELLGQLPGSGTHLAQLRLGLLEDIIDFHRAVARGSGISLGGHQVGLVALGLLTHRLLNPVQHLGCSRQLQRVELRAPGAVGGPRLRRRPLRRGALRADAPQVPGDLLHLLFRRSICLRLRLCFRLCGGLHFGVGLRLLPEQRLLVGQLLQPVAGSVAGQGRALHALPAIDHHGWDAVVEAVARIVQGAARLYELVLLQLVLAITGNALGGAFFGRRIRVNALVCQQQPAIRRALQLLVQALRGHAAAAIAAPEVIYSSAQEILAGCRELLKDARLLLRSCAQHEEQQPYLHCT
mmetsp:Transcript_125336/g.297517  ORF Transcript_125336/g.297517 Transcript_125336/m.297517 type:complete len:349 (-) Transcript_125336:31-1077(-)